MIPRDVSRTLELWAYHPWSRDDFAKNFLSRRVAVSPDRDHSQADNPSRWMFASLCAVPRGHPAERFPDYQELLNWLQPGLLQYDPPGLWMPKERQTYTSHGALFFSEDYRSASDPKEWSEYLLVGRDGYIEFGRQAGFPYKGRPYFSFSPLVAWIQRFSAFVLDIKQRQSEQTPYALLLSMAGTAGASLAVFGHHWREPWDRMNGPSPMSIQPFIQIARGVEAEDDPRAVGSWFAERIANGFGENFQPPRCFNHPSSDGSAGPPGELPRDKREY